MLSIVAGLKKKKKKSSITHAGLSAQLLKITKEFEKTVLYIRANNKVSVEEASLRLFDL